MDKTNHLKRESACESAIINIHPERVNTFPRSLKESCKNTSFDMSDTISHLESQRRRAYPYRSYRQRPADRCSESSTTSLHFCVRSPIGSFARARDHIWQSCRSKVTRKRLIFKNGECNVSRINVKRRHQRYLADIFTTLVDIKWRWILVLFIFTFCASWMFFALLWWLIASSHGDLKHYAEKDWKSCVENVHDYTTALLFSIETQHTIGYGGRMTTDECPTAIVLMMMQSCFGVIIQALMTGVVFAKLARSKKRAETLMFSKSAVICKRDGRLSLMIRVGDMRRSHIIQTTIRGLLIKKHITEEGEVLPLAEFDVPFRMTSGSNTLLLVWPLILEHHIDEASPFYDMSPSDLSHGKFELIIILEGVIESTGLLTQARTSYLPNEILWGHRFDRLMAFHRENGQYIVDYSRFNSTSQIDCPWMSAKRMESLMGADSGKNDDDSDKDFSGTESCTELPAITMNVNGYNASKEQLLDSNKLAQRSSMSLTSSIMAGDGGFCPQKSKEWRHGGRSAYSSPIKGISTCDFADYIKQSESVTLPPV